MQIIQHDDETIEMLFWNNDTLVDKNFYSKKKKEYSCTPEEVRIPLGSVVSSFFQMAEGMTLVRVSWLTLYLSKNSDNELIVGAWSRGIGIELFVIPIAGSAFDYVRFKQRH